MKSTLNENYVDLISLRTTEHMTCEECIKFLYFMFDADSVYDIEFIIGTRDNVALSFTKEDKPSLNEIYYLWKKNKLLLVASIMLNTRDSIIWRRRITAILLPDSTLKELTDQEYNNLLFNISDSWITKDEFSEFIEDYVTNVYCVKTRS